MVTTDFSPAGRYCRPCRRRQANSVYAESQERLRRLREIEAAKTVAQVSVAFIAPNAAEGKLLEAMATYLGAHGFTELHLALTRLEHDLARANRSLLSRQGWIA